MHIRPVSAQKKPVDPKEALAILRGMFAAGDIEPMFAVFGKLLTDLMADNALLTLRLGQALRQRYARSSEKVDPAQLMLFLGALTATKPETPSGSESEPASSTSSSSSSSSSSSTTESTTESEKPRRRTGRNPLPAHLPRRRTVVPITPEECACEQCGMARRVFGHERSEILDYEPGGFFVVEILRQKAVDACRCAHKPTLVTAPLLPSVIPAGRVGPGLLSKVLVAKYGDHCPLERQCTMYAREGVSLAPATLGDWVAAGAVMLCAISDRIQKEALAADVLWTDDTGLRTLDPDHPAGVKLGHIWTYVGDRRWVAFKYTPDWKADAPRKVLAGREGPVVSDGYAGYKLLFKMPDTKLVDVGCWMHARRYFKKALDAHELRAAIPIDYIRRLYEVERLADARELDPAARLQLRQELSKPAYEAIGQWIRTLHGAEPPKSHLGAALTYAVNHWTALGRFLDDGRIPLDNGEAERALRKIALGRLNYLFAGSEEGGKRAAIIYTVIGTCILNSVNPFEYLRDVFTKIAAGWPASRLDELLPPNWAAAQQQAKEKAAAEPAAA